MHPNETDYKTCMDYLDTLVSMPSPSGEENAVAAFVEGELRQSGWHARRALTEDGRFALLGEMSGGCAGDSLLLAGHIDTVSPSQGWETDPYRPTRRETNDPATGRRQERVYGVGACDMKAGIAMMLTIAKMMPDVREHLAGKLCLAFVPDEEAHSVGVRALIESGIAADFCLMPEPHFDTAISGAPGKLLLEAHVTGRSAHGARPSEGVNAVSETASLLCALDKLPLLSSPDMAGQPFVPLSVKGGPEKYSLSVPDRCVTVISKQLVPGETREGVLASLRSVEGELALRGQVTWETPPPYYPPYRVAPTPGTARFFERFEAACKAELGHAVPLGFGTSVSDANCLVAEAGIPVLVFGPLGGCLHQANEWVDVESVKKCLDIYAAFIFDRELRRENEPCGR